VQGGKERKGKGKGNGKGKYKHKHEHALVGWGRRQRRHIAAVTLSTYLPVCPKASQAKTPALAS
jgi:hypothetical protein